MAVNFAYKVCIFLLVGFFNMLYNLMTQDFISPLKKVVLWIFIALDN
jgi:hypothetical protein